MQILKEIGMFCIKKSHSLNVFFIILNKYNKNKQKTLMKRKQK